MSVALVLTIIAAVAIITGTTLGYFLVQLANRPVTSPLDSPPCDRCGNNTGKPWLRRNTRAWWACDPCEREVTDQMFDMFQKLNEQRDAILRLRAGLPSREEPTT